MAICRALVAAALLGLGGALAVPIDQQSLVQLSAQSSSGQPGGLLFRPKRSRRNETSSMFPLVSNKFGFDAHFVGSAEFYVDLMSFHVHAYTIAMYLNSTSELWSSSPGKISRRERVARMNGEVFFETIAYSKYVNNENMAKFTERLDFFAQQEHLKDYAGPLERYKQAFLKAPKVTSGSHICLYPSQGGITPLIAGKNMGLVNSSFLGSLLLSAYLGPDTDLPEFRDNVFAQLGEGKPMSVGEPAAVHAQAVNKAWGVILFIAIGVAATLSCGCFWYCCMRKRAKA
eukprot:CAMPEP_0171170012 /NCGR_PEP_ID=MMETSP0790-20130122/8500_1 /TAXON_ID=2925 /ORGANISM="Alexandrium catenella, Strain OF101" /LENGTH=286 /DNA_ID=CAMNT_0011634857 /DNA_START=12 /DNA_END=872 /DNA_ORIENTATION=+